MESNNNERLFTLFNQTKKEKDAQNVKSTDDKILLVDFLNLFIRSFSGSPSMNDDGEHVGGITGSLYSIGNAIKMIGATRCIVVSDGENSAQRKRKIYPEYKQRRKVKMNLNRAYEFQTEEQEQESMKYQMLRLVQYLKCMPIQMFSIDAMEADDVIAYLAKEVFIKPENKITIMSSDRDFLQLVDNRIQVWSPTKKKMYTEQQILDEYGISPQNFLSYRVLLGDASDNINGIDGCGKITIPKNLPMLSENNKYTMKFIVEYSEKQNSGKKKKKFYQHIIEGNDILHRNEQLMQLEFPDMPAHSKLKIIENINKPIPHLNKYEIHIMSLHDKITTAMRNMDGWLLTTFNILNAFAINQNTTRKLI